MTSEEILADQTRAVTNRVANKAANPDIGIKLGDLLVEAGLTDVEVVEVTDTIPIEIAMRIFLIEDNARVSLGDVADSWLEKLRQQRLVHMTMYIARGKK